MLRLLLCRHGQSEADLEPRRLEGNANFPLTALGQRQAQALATWIGARYTVDAIVTSPLLRARSTAEAIQGRTGSPLTVEPRLAERSNGLLAGLTPAEADRLYPVTHPVPIHHRPPEGESYLDLYRRVAEYWSELRTAPPPDGQTLLLVSHGGALTALLQVILGLPPSDRRLFATGDTGFHELLCGPDDELRVLRINHLAHLGE